MRRESLRQCLVYSVYNYNILPLTSRCNVSCIFCSHKQNPPGIESFFLPPLTWEEVEDLTLCLTPEKKIVIGESASRIMEGEPLTHPRFLEIMELLRIKFPSTPLQLTTNGILLSSRLVKGLKALEPLEINLSLNSADSRRRADLMGNPLAGEVRRSLSLLREQGLTFHGSIVPLPWITGWEDLASTVEFLVEAGAQTIRVFIPGFTRWGLNIPQPPVAWEESIREYFLDLKTKNAVPITLEPPGLGDLRTVIGEVVPGSKGAQAGLKGGQEILSINGVTPFSRVEAFHSVSSPGKYLIEVSAGGNESGQIVDLELGKGEKSGLVMDYDLAPWVVKDIIATLRRCSSVYPLILASEWGEPLLKAGLLKGGREDLLTRVIPVVNVTFGGNIRSAGLLLVEDFSRALETYLDKGGQADCVLLPALAFDHRGRDLRGNSYYDLRAEYNLEVYLI